MIISKLLDKGIMTKTEIVKYLRYFIRFNGKKYGNELAVEKWQNDLRFTLQYKINRQPTVYFTKVKKWTSKRNDRIKTTMTLDSYRELSRERIKRWKTEHPEEYAASRKNNGLAQQNESTKQKRNASLMKWREAHPKEFAEYRRKQIEAAHSDEAKAKRSKSLKEWNRTHPEEVKQRGIKAGKASQKAVNMLDLITGKVLKSFNSQQEAAEWLVQQGLAKNTNCKSMISSVCLKKQVPGHGTRKQAHGFGWEFKEVN